MLTCWRLGFTSSLVSPVPICAQLFWTLPATGEFAQSCVAAGTPSSLAVLSELRATAFTHSWTPCIRLCRACMYAFGVIDATMGYRFHRPCHCYAPPPPWLHQYLPVLVSVYLEMFPIPSISNATLFLLVFYLVFATVSSCELLHGFGEIEYTWLVYKCISMCWLEF
jgi:hypothetical protein